MLLHIAFQTPIYTEASDNSFCETVSLNQPYVKTYMLIEDNTRNMIFC